MSRDALQSYYRTEAVRGMGLTAARLRRPPEMVVIFPDEAAAGEAQGRWVADGAGRLGRSERGIRGASSPR